MLLCIDIGNTNIKLGLFEGEAMRRHWRIATDRANLADEYAVLLLSLFASEGIKKADIAGCAISSVVPALTVVFSELVQQYFKLDALILEAGTITGMKINTDYPAEVGSDLVMNALAARHLYGAPLIVIGFGTATTFVAVSAQGDFEGVSIAPGIMTSGDSALSSHLHPAPGGFRAPRRRHRQEYDPFDAGRFCIRFHRVGQGAGQPPAGRIGRKCKSNCHRRHVGLDRARNGCDRCDRAFSGVNWFEIALPD